MPKRAIACAPSAMEVLPASAAVVRHWHFSIARRACQSRAALFMQRARAPRDECCTRRILDYVFRVA